jgi:hypothetical protein
MIAMDFTVYASPSHLPVGSRPMQLVARHPPVAAIAGVAGANINPSVLAKITASEKRSQLALMLLAGIAISTS